MKQHIPTLLSGAFRAFPLNLLIRLTDVRRVLPFYHAVADTALPHLKHLYPVIPPAVFEKQLDYLLKHYEPVSYEALMETKVPSKNQFMLTFDDGLRQFHDLAAPILLRKGIPATCFLNTGFIDNKSMFYRLKVSLLIDRLQHTHNQLLEKEIKEACARYGISYRQPGDLKKISDTEKNLLDELQETNFEDFLSREQPYMTTVQIQKLRQQGFTFGAHSVSHPYYPLLSLSEQVKETLESVRTVKQNFSMNDGLFSFPYTDYEIGSSFFEAIQSEVQLSFGTANIKEDSISTNYQRIPMEIPGIEKAEILLKKQYVQHLIKKAMGKSTIMRHK